MSLERWRYEDGPVIAQTVRWEWRPNCALCWVGCLLLVLLCFVATGLSCYGAVQLVR